MTAGPDLAGLLTIWPIVESLAINTPVGDLITLARTSSSLRSSLHGRFPAVTGSGRTSTSREWKGLDPEIGRHQTHDWAHLKSIAQFTCSSATHTRGQKVRPCVYCSKPICDACIVRDSFKHRNENTFKNRLRYFCKDCWSEGCPTQKFRYPSVSIDDNGEIDFSIPDKINVEEKPPHLEASEFCECNLKDNGWLCLECKEEQNSSSSAPLKLILDPSPETHGISCFGLDCDNLIDVYSPDKDRRRVCLWCQKPLRRQYGGEDRHVWNMKTIEARTRNAESRSRDLEEYNRRRLRVMRMSRGEMRGTTELCDDQPIFVRHLDVFNYRNWMSQGWVPSPEAVWKSKNGYWRYRPGFLYAVQKRCRYTMFTRIGGVSVDELSAMTKGSSLRYARLNRDVYPKYTGYGVPSIREDEHPERSKNCLNELRARLLEMHFAEGKSIGEINDILKEQYGLDIIDYEVERQLDKWSKQRGKAPETCAEYDVANGEVTTASGVESARCKLSTYSEQTDQGVASASDRQIDNPRDLPPSIQDAVGMAFSPAFEGERLVNDVADGNVLPNDSPPGILAVVTEDQANDDPPPYTP